MQRGWATKRMHAWQAVAGASAARQGKIIWLLVVRATRNMLLLAHQGHKAAASGPQRSQACTLRRICTLTHAQANN